MKIIIHSAAKSSPLLNAVPADLKERVQLIHCRSREELNWHAPGVQVLIAAGRLTPAALAACPDVHLVQALSAGVDNLPLAYMEEHGIRLANVRGIHQIQMSEFAMLMMLQWARRADLHFLNQMDKTWGRRVPAAELYGQTVGILGSGAIGQAIAAKARAFGMRILGYSRSGRSIPGFNRVSSGPAGLQYTLSESDYIIVLLPATTETRHTLGMEQFKSMKPTACLINLARGSVINEPELIEALREGTIAGAALDVFQEEPLPTDSPLWELPNVILTPHVAGLSPHYTSRAADIVFDNIRRYLENPEAPFQNEIDLQKGY